MTDTDTKIISLPTALFITFLVLKLTNTIDWSWWWITAPLWIPVGLVIVIFLFLLVLAFIGLALGGGDD